MSIHEIIKQGVSIILAHAKPEQIWLYGSRTAGEATETSDIDKKPFDVIITTSDEF